MLELCRNVVYRDKFQGFVLKNKNRTCHIGDTPDIVIGISFRLRSNLSI